MTRTRWFAMALLAVVLGSSVAWTAPDVVVAPTPRPAIDLKGYKTVAEAARANPKEFAPAKEAPGVPGYLGVVIGEAGGKAVIEAVAPDSPAADAGLKVGDVLVKIGRESVALASAARDQLRTYSAGTTVDLTVSRKGELLEASVVLKPVSKPFTPAARAVMGVTFGEAVKGGGIKVDVVTPGGPSAKAGVKGGDVLLKIDGVDVNELPTVRQHLANKRGGDRVELIILRNEIRREIAVVLESDDQPGRGNRAWDDRLPRLLRKSTYRLAVLGVEYPDVKHNPKVTPADWEEALFSRGTYTGKSATGQTVYGSMADYYREISYGALRVEGKFLGWVEVGKKRTEYSTGSGTSAQEKTALLTEALNLYQKQPEASLKDYDGILFLYAGGRVQTTRGGLYWPHRASFRANDKTWPYIILQEGGNRMTDISVICHETGHLLGLPDLYARPEQPGSEGVGVWCAMSEQLPNGRPQHFSAWSKEQLGWIKPAVLDPRVRQKLILSPIEDDATQCIKIPVRPDGSEYFLLENRRRIGWDSNLPGEGLLVWRVFSSPGQGKQSLFLEESHGIEGPLGPSSYPVHVPFPSTANASFTPFTTPSSKSQLGGGLPVWITNIRKLPDGRVTFEIGYEYQ